MEAQAWAGCPAGLGPQGSGQRGATAPQGMQKGPPFLLSPQIPPQEGSGAWDDMGSC